MRTRFSHDDLVGVGVDDEVGIMRNYDDLASGFGRDEKRHQLIEHGLRIEILFGLVYDQRAIVGIIESKIEQQ